jgi:hypothetical protein
MNSNWLDSYYEALEFFYWEPQHIGRKKNISGEFNTLDKVMRHLRKIEVTLNHNINQFLLIAPKSFHRTIFNEFFDEKFASDFEMHGRGVENKFDLVDAMQPDFAFTSAKEVLSIEMKVAAKSSIDQVLKYALLGLAIEIKEGNPKRHFLGFLGAGEFKDQWKEKFVDSRALRCAIEAADISEFIGKQPLRFRPFEARLRDIAKEMIFGFMNYQSFTKLLRDELPAQADASPAAEAYTNLIQGLVYEFKRRELAQ